MTSTTLLQAVIWMARSMGLDPVRDREEAVRYVNKFRNLLYNSFNRVQLFDDYEQCFTICEFHQDCHGQACPTYRGFTATLDMGGIMGAWESLQPVTLRSRWREVHQGKGAKRGAQVELFPLNGSFATERDMVGASELTLTASSVNDDGKHVHVVAIGDDGLRKELIFTLTNGVPATNAKVVCRIISVSMPPDLCANVEIAQDTGRVLSIYPPGVLVPQYKRYKVTGSFTCDSSTILVQSNRIYIPLTENADVIEVGDELVMDAAGKYFKYGENTTDVKEIRAAQLYLNQMYGFLDNLKDRQMGRSKQDGLIPSVKIGMRVRKRALPGLRR